MDPDGNNVVMLSDRAAYDTTKARDSFSADQRYRAFVADNLRFDGQRVPTIYFYDYLYNTSDILSQFGAGIAYAPVWSPARDQIALVSSSSSNDEIWVVNRDRSGLLQLTNDVNYDKHPSWSPNGSEIVFWSNRSGKAQIWIMDVEGNNKRIINFNDYNDWNPVWVKYTDLPIEIPATPTPVGRQQPFEIYE